MALLLFLTGRPVHTCLVRNRRRRVQDCLCRSGAVESQCSAGREPGITSPCGRSAVGAHEFAKVLGEALKQRRAVLCCALVSTSVDVSIMHHCALMTRVHCHPQRRYPCAKIGVPSVAARM